MLVFWLLLTGCLALLAYHHLIYPLWLRRVPMPAARPARWPESWPRIAVLVPAYREAAHIEAMIHQLAALDYPADRLVIEIHCDGSPDETPALARRAISALLPDAPAIQLVAHAANRGKVAVLNEAIAGLDSEIVVLFDASSIVSPNTLRQLAPDFEDPSVGVVCPSYRLAEGASGPEASYWRYQAAIRRHEAGFAAAMGAHGAGYAFRRSAWTPLPASTINDDFVLPMRIVTAGLRLVDRPDLVIGEREQAGRALDLRRRRRLGAGNLQQVFLCHRLLWANGWRIAVLFGSGKLLRALAPLLLALAVFAAFGLAATAGRPSDLVPLAFVALAVLMLRLPEPTDTGLPARALRAGRYALGGYLSMGHGMLDLVSGRFADDRRLAERAAMAGPEPGNGQVLSPVTRALKRGFDILIASLAFLVLLVIGPLIALAIWLDSRGPIFYRQLRVGAALPDRTNLFYLVKFRTMRVDAEAATGAVWAAKSDPRVTRLGRFLRKTRLDELPQCLNVLRGEMSIVGPRPERPSFFTRLEAEVPFYTERTFGLKPGLTGLAQVSTGYDATIDDVRLKILFDHSYALKVYSPLAWFRTDLTIIAKTFLVMGLGLGR